MITLLALFSLPSLQFRKCPVICTHNLHSICYPLCCTDAFATVIVRWQVSICHSQSSWFCRVRRNSAEGICWQFANGTAISRRSRKHPYIYKSGVNVRGEHVLVDWQRETRPEQVPCRGTVALHEGLDVTSDTSIPPQIQAFVLRAPHKVGDCCLCSKATFRSSTTASSASDVDLLAKFCIANSSVLHCREPVRTFSKKRVNR